jgi:NTE family protein
MVNDERKVRKDRTKRTDPLPKVAVACQGGGIHASFTVGVLTEILRDIQQKARFELTALSGTSAGALCTLMVWYGLATKNGVAGSEQEAIDRLNNFWDQFAATRLTEKLINQLTYAALRTQEMEVLGFSASVFGLNPRSTISKAITAGLPFLKVRRQYFDLHKLLNKACPQFNGINWNQLGTRLLIGASEVISGIETIFDSDCNIPGGEQARPVTPTDRWRERLPLSLSGVAASGTLPQFLEAERINGWYYWDGLYSQNPPIREFLAKVSINYRPDEIWVVRINPQQCAQQPQSTAGMLDRENELMGNLSLNKELDFIVKVNQLRQLPAAAAIASTYKDVTVRTIMMTEQTVGTLRYSSKFNRSHDLMDQLRTEGRQVAQAWLSQWPTVGSWPADAAYRPRPRFY